MYICRDFRGLQASNVKRTQTRSVSDRFVVQVLLDVLTGLGGVDGNVLLSETRLNHVVLEDSLQMCFGL
jgi:hypothetical protein